MASAQDVQDLLRLLTTGRNKLPMMAAMGRVKALQAANLRSISDIASSDVPTLRTALNDEKAAKSLLAACKSHIKSITSTSPTNKRPTSPSHTSSHPSKRLKSAYDLPSTPVTPSEIEASLSLPTPSTDEVAISNKIIYTNRAPLVLAFAVKVLEYAMPEQPLSSRLSLAQAVVSANSRSKAVSLGIEKGGENGWEVGQPKVRVLGREVSVLKRSGYVWEDENEDKVEVERDHGEKEQEESTTHERTPTQSASSPSTLAASSRRTTQEPPTWSSSSPITLKKSTFVAHCLPLSNPTLSSASAAISSLLKAHPNLSTATHTITAFRTCLSSSTQIHESSDDDGESGGGAHLLRILQENNIVNVILVVSRWYGGVLLGPDRWRIMSSVAREALAGLRRVMIVDEEGKKREPLWGLDVHGEGKGNGTVGGMPVHRPEGSRAYLLKSFGSVEKEAEESVVGNGGRDARKSVKKKSAKEVQIEREENLGLLLGALGLLFESWTEHISADDLDRRAWEWYVRVRPDVESGVAGWGGKGEVKLKEILELRRRG